jgi:hypothetical protein
MNGKLLIAGMTVAIAIPLTACGGGGAALSANGGTAPTGNGGGASTISSNQADVQACTNLQKAAAAFLANKNQDTLSALASALAAPPGAGESSSLNSAITALSTDVQYEITSGVAFGTSQMDENAVADGCASAGVKMPAGFTG